MRSKEAINNLEIMSLALGKAANEPKHYNTTFAYYLEQISLKMHKQAEELRDLEYMLDTTPSINTHNS